MSEFVESVKFKVLDIIAQVQAICCQPSSTLKINGRTFNIVKVLGEGGFSFVYLAQDTSSGRQFALKKIRCPTGNEGVKEVMREIEAYRRFRHRNIIRIFDSSVEQDRDGEGKIVYLFLPFYQRGNLQDIINSNAITGARLPEKQMLKLFRGACLGLRAMHDFRVKPKATVNSSPDAASRDLLQESARSGLAPPSREPSPAPDMRREIHHDVDHENDDHNERHKLLEQHPRDDDPYDDEGSESKGYALLATKSRGGQTKANVLFDGDDELSKITEDAGADAASGAEGIHTPYAHRDAKPANIMIDDEGEAILMDFGSTVRARVECKTRQQALIQQDMAAEHSTMPYRAPELFDVKTGVTLDEKVDIWSMGCTLFALAYSHSPFENTQTMEQGGSIAMAVMSAAYKHPTNSPYSDGVKKLIDMCLVVDPKGRPDIHQLIGATDEALN
ncbi:other/NAK protein kinase [Cantharellus anzutake]|uniref:other/NAK protein kinase n=1 Tax=Cantharellus anzutake TaxID=1750568 RepID=UPI0019039E61|nr:other/NAK protein kinase [Cantharellus anzutake]KAF8339761.1 other/NAK protein kinase [Cantharellus anzutake]